MNAWKYLSGVLVVLLAINLFGCATYQPNYSSFIQEADRRHVPLLIYNTSWNDPHGGGGRLAVWVANNQDKRIDSIELTVAACGAKGAAEYSTPLVLGGPFYGHTKSVSLPSWPIDARYYPSAGYIYEEAAISSGHLLIQSIKISYSNGKQDIYKQDVDQLLTKNISNYCSTTVL